MASRPQGGDEPFFHTMGNTCREQVFFALRATLQGWLSNPYLSGNLRHGRAIVATTWH